MLRTLALAIATACVVGCTADPAPTDVNPQDLAWGPLAVYRGQPNGDQALATGVLQINAECAFITTGANAILLAWPDSHTRWDHASTSIVYTQNDGTTARLFNGQRWGFGGSSGAPAFLIERLDWVAPPAPECAPTEIWLVGEVVEPN